MSRTTHRQLTLAIITLPVISVLPVSAQAINEDTKIVASDAAEGDGFGFSVAISGTTAIVGALRNDDAGFNSGSAYLFDTETWQQLYKLTASDAAARDLFGESVAISGTTAIVGAERDGDAGSFSGSAYLFDTDTGQQLFKLTASDAAPLDHFGTSVAISGTIAIVGAFGNDDAGSESGSAYLFDTETGQQLFKFTATDAAENDRFGISVAISGTTAIVGAVRNGNPGHSSGSAYLFDTETGQELAKLTSSDPTNGDAFGLSVAISGTTAIVGAFGDTHAGPNSGSAYLFDSEAGQQLFKLTASDAAANDWFGDSVAISGTMAIVGASNKYDGVTNSGSAYVFDTETGLQIEKFTASDADANDDFGNSVAILGTVTIIGARGDSDAGTASGSVYVFDFGCILMNPANLNGDLSLNFLDVSAFLVAFGAQDIDADFVPDGNFNFLDVSAFLVAFGAGCP